MNPTRFRFLDSSSRVMVLPFPRLGMLANVTRDKATLLRMTGYGAAALVFSLLVIAVRVRWVPLEDVDRGVANGLNRLIAPSHILVQLMGGISRLGSYGVLGWLIAI